MSSIVFKEPTKTSEFYTSFIFLLPQLGGYANVLDGTFCWRTVLSRKFLVFMRLLKVGATLLGTTYLVGRIFYYKGYTSGGKHISSLQCCSFTWLIWRLVKF